MMPEQQFNQLARCRRRLFDVDLSLTAMRWCRAFTHRSNDDD